MGTDRNWTLYPLRVRTRGGSEESHPCGLLQEERAGLTRELHSLREQRGRLHAELETYRECDPEVVQEIREYSTARTG